MPRYKVIGWYASHPEDETSTAYSRVVDVEARDRHGAFDAGEVKLRQTAAKGQQLLNWYVRTPREDGT